jgi:hypothetical protein
MTLMELIVGILMFTIISIVLSMLLAPILSSYTRANDFAEYNALLDNIANQIISDLSQAVPVPDPDPPNLNTNPDFTPGPGGWAVNAGGDLTITTQNRVITYTVAVDADSGLEVLRRNGVDVFSADFYKRKNVSFRLDADNVDNTAFRLSVRLTERGNTPFVIDREYAVRPLMLNQHR